MNSAHDGASLSPNSPEITGQGSSSSGPKSKPDQSILKKNKGKQKMGPQQPGLLIIKFSESSLDDLHLEVPNLYDCSVPSLRREIRRKVGGITLNRRMRLIHGGKILTDSTNIARDVANNRASSLRNWRNVGETDSTTSLTEIAPTPIRLFIHCSLGNILTPQELQNEGQMETEAPNRSTLPELRGFDRLRETGFSEEDIIQLRHQFGQLYGYGTNNGTNREEMTRMEEQWIDTGVMDTLPGSTSLVSGDYIDDMIGFLMGTFLGVVAFFFLKEGGLFSSRQHRALIAGSGINFLFGLLRLLA